MSAPNPTPTVGLLYPGFSAEDDFAAYERRAAGRIRLPLVHTTVQVDAHAVGPLLDLGADDRLTEGALELLPRQPDCLLWACTSGSFVFGWEGAHQQVTRLSNRTGLPASSTSLAFVHAAQHLGVGSVAVAASYPAEVAELFVAFLARAEITVLELSSHGIFTAAEVGRLDRDKVTDLVCAADRPDADAVLVPDTALHSLAWLDDLESAVGKPVLTANQVTIWEGLRLLGGAEHASAVGLPGLGTLFSGHPRRTSAPERR
ncbi:MAG: maleate cis-trans isomerase [Microlunatus sp.]|nr:maleate cis-trans isomerase [Microlunatus sp.]MDN5769566.1 maleate cis-trans isomerase [Microlunatus sp.]MDN5803580.1 maleate cis-trans isomerase [Microlunatus sp.]